MKTYGITHDDIISIILMIVILSLVFNNISMGILSTVNILSIYMTIKMVIKYIEKRQNKEN